MISLSEEALLKMREEQKGEKGQINHTFIEGWNTIDFNRGYKPLPQDQ